MALIAKKVKITALNHGVKLCIKICKLAFAEIIQQIRLIVMLKHDHLSFLIKRHPRRKCIISIAKVQSYVHYMREIQRLVISVDLLILILFVGSRLVEGISISEMLAIGNYSGNLLTLQHAKFTRARHVFLS
jgi:hypothetical protein